MGNRKCTPWISGNKKPVRIGVYQRDYRNAKGDRDVGITFSYWDGKRWGLYGETEREAWRWSELSSTYQNLPWRGLTEEAKEQK